MIADAYYPSLRQNYRRGHTADLDMERTCPACGEPMATYPGGSYCDICTPSQLLDTLARGESRLRLADGYLPLEMELIA